MTQRIYHTLIWLLLAIPALASEPPKSLMGAQDFKPSVEHPFGWRGDGSGRFPGATPVTEWSTTKNVKWGIAVGKSHSSPILTDALVFVTSEPNLLFCIGRNDGKIRWKAEIKPADLTNPQSRKVAEEYVPPKDGSGMAAATPITDGKRVYAVYGNGIVCAVNLDGKRAWTTCIEAEQSTGYGRSASPIIAGGKLIVSMTNLYAFDLETGKQLWVNEDAKSGYGTPAAMKVGATEVVITPVGDVAQVSDGKIVDSNIGHTIHSSPFAEDGVVYFGESMFSAVRLNAAFKDEEAWNAMISGEIFSSPLLYSGILYLATGEGELVAFDAKGKGSQDPLINARSLFEDGGGYASLTLAGKYLFLNSNGGEMVMLEATREAPAISHNRLKEGTGSTPVFSGKSMFIRDGETLYCIGQ